MSQNTNQNKNFAPDVAARVEEVRDTAVAVRAEMGKVAGAGSLLLAQAQGRIQAFQFSEAVSRIGMLQQLQRIKETKAYKGVSVLNPKTGQPTYVTSWEDFCLAAGFSRTKIDEDLQNLAAFGADFLNLSEKLCLGYRDLRGLRSQLKGLPEHDKAEAMERIRRVQDPDALKDVIEDFAARNQALKAQLKTAEEEKVAKQKVIDKKSDKVAKLEAELDRLTSLTPDEQAQEQGKQIQRAANALYLSCSHVAGDFNAAMVSATALRDIPDNAAARQMAADCLSVLVQAMANTLMQGGWDIHFQAMLRPAWLDESIPDLVGATDTPAE